MSDVDSESNEEEVEHDDPEASKRPMRTKQNTIKYESDEEGEATPQENDEGVSSAMEVDEEAKPTNGEVVENGDSAMLQEQPDSTNNQEVLKDFVHNVIVTNASVDMTGVGSEPMHKNNLGVVDEENVPIDCIEAHGLASPARSACVSPASSNGGVYSVSTRFSLSLRRN